MFVKRIADNIFSAASPLFIPTPHAPHLGGKAFPYAEGAIGRLTGQSDVIGGTGANVSWAFTINTAQEQSRISLTCG